MTRLCSFHPDQLLLGTDWIGSSSFFREEVSLSQMVLWLLLGEKSGSESESEVSVSCTMKSARLPSESVYSDSEAIESGEAGEYSEYSEEHSEYSEAVEYSETVEYSEYSEEDSETVDS